LLACIHTNTITHRPAAVTELLWR